MVEKMNAMLDRLLVDPDRQMPLPFPAAERYAREVMEWARDLPPSGMKVRRDVAYGPNPLQRYNVFAPPGARGAPVLVFWHGGGWTNGYREYVSFMAPHVVRMGCILVAPSYRLAPQHPFPAAIDDALAALQHLTGHIGQCGGAADRIYLAGHSAGGHLAALTALRSAALEMAGVSPARIRGCLPISGIMDLHHPAPEPDSLEERVYKLVLSWRDQDATLSPLYWTAGNRIPFVLTCGASDSERVVRSNQRMSALLAAQPGASQFHIAAGLDHFGTHTALRQATAPWYGFLAKLLDGEPG
ncbi:alpha/beta hydrolase [Variovorax saccharolyticus]|uniref:alpha/beta hydrolase n=1 Tax=Variovorax saccharolyticus TaxID=3053516 RepID=UPI0025785622|nr:alpha/beta hydrolase [Variovorax sp. J31P216]MDM0024349.1 alpha/beta hydrolase [Variovorax sp. J31P216]